MGVILQAEQIEEDIFEEFEFVQWDFRGKRLLRFFRESLSTWRIGEKPTMVKHHRMMLCVILKKILLKN
jgi:hypothetical protein